MSDRVFIVAELSANHGAKLQTALDTVTAAARAGADAIKIQTYTPDTLTLPFTTEPFIVRTDNVWAGKTLHQLYGEAMTPWAWTAELKAHAEANGLVFFSTPFDTTAVDFLEQHHVSLYKIASFELTDLALVSYVARQGKPVILSTGMATLEEIARAVATCREAGNDQITLLRCVSSYPARAEDMNLASMDALAQLGTVIGLSDHTRDNVAAVTAVALGARVIEKHFILDRALGGPDAFFSLEPAEFALLVKEVRAVEAALGTPRFGPTASEAKSLVFRRSLFVSAEVNAGDVLTCDNVRSIRPGHGLPSSELPNVLGCLATRDIAAGTPLTREVVGPRPLSNPVLLTPGAPPSEWAAVFSAPAGVHAESFVADGGALAVRKLQGTHWWLDVAIAPERIGTGFLPGLVQAGCDLIRARGGTLVRMLAVDALKPLGFYQFAQGQCERQLSGATNC